MHFPRDVDADAIRPFVERCFENPPPRTKTKLYNREGEARRDALWYARYAADGFFPLYRTGSYCYHEPDRCRAGVKGAVAPHPMPDWLCSVLDDISARHGLPVLNHVVLHRYVDGSDTIGMHHDKYMDIDPGSTIVSVSIGAQRDFRIGKKNEYTTFAVSDGDTVLIEDAVNREMKHGIPPRKRCTGTRYSITARTICTFGDGSVHYVSRTDPHYEPRKRRRLGART